MPVEATTRVSQERVAEYMRVLGAEFPGTIPETFLVVLAAPAWRKLFFVVVLGISLARTLQVAQAIEVLSALQIGDEISSTVQITQLRVRDKKTILSCRVELAANQQLRGIVESTFWCMKEVT